MTFATPPTVVRAPRNEDQMSTAISLPHLRQRWAALCLALALLAALLVAAPLRAVAADCTIPADRVAVTVTNEARDIDTSRPWDKFEIAATLSNLDGLAEGCEAVITLPDLFVDILTTTLYLNADGTSSATPQADTVAVMAVDGPARTMTFTLTDYAATHSGVSAHGWTAARLTSSLERDQTVPVVVDVNGETRPVVDIGTEPCPPDCPVVPVDAAKYGIDNGDGTGVVVIQSPVIPTAGTEVAFTDTLTSAGQSITGVLWARGFDCVDTWGAPGLSAADGSCDTTRHADLTAVGTAGTYTVTTTQDDQFIRLRLGMTFTGEGPWSDQATVSYAGGPETWTARTAVEGYDVGGFAAGSEITPTPSPTPSPSPTPTPSPAVTPPVVTPPVVTARPTSTPPVLRKVVQSG